MTMKLIPFEADNVVAIQTEGRIASDDYDVVLADVQDKLQRHSKLRIYVEMATFTGISAEAFFKDLKFGLGHMDRFDREAVVTDKAWMQRFASAADKLFPGIDIKVFASQDKDVARDWVVA